MSTFDFRILLETIEGRQSSYMSQSFVDTSVDLVLSSSQVYNRITGSVSCSYQDGLEFTGSFVTNLNTNFTFKDSTILSASLSGSNTFGKIEFIALDTDYDRLKRYKFIGEKVCDTLGLPNNQWIYVDQARFTTDDEDNFLEGDLFSKSVYISENLSLAPSSNISTNLSFYNDTGSDKHIRFIDSRNSTAVFSFGYNKEDDAYEMGGRNTGRTTRIRHINRAEINEISHSASNTGILIEVDKGFEIRGDSGNNPTIKLQEDSTNDRLELQMSDDGEATILSTEDLKIGTSGFTKAIFIDKSEDRVGINTDEPQDTLHVDGNITSSGHVSASHFSGDGSGLTNVTATTSPGGSNTQVQFNDGGSTAGDAGLVYDKNTDTLTTVNISATSLNVTSITSSIVTSSILQTEGSNIFGDTTSDTHTFNGDIILTADSKLKSSETATNNFLEFDDDAGSPANQTILSTVSSLGLIIDGNGNGTGEFKILKDGTDSTATQLFRIANNGDITASGNISASGHVFLESNKLISFGSNPTVSAGIPTDNFIGYSSTGDHILIKSQVIRLDQSVGIGVDTPSSKLEVDGDFTATNITASGNISSSGDIIATGDLHINGNLLTSGSLKFPTPSESNTNNGIVFFDTSSNAPNTKVNAIKWDFSNDDAFIYAIQSQSDSTYMVNELADNVVNDKFVWWFNNFAGKTTDSFPLMLEGNKAVINYYYDRRATFHRDSNATDGAANNVDFYLLKSGSTSVSTANSLIHGDVSAGKTTLNDIIFVDGNLTASGNISASRAVQGLSLTATGLTQNRVPVIGSGGSIQDTSALTFQNNKLSITGTGAGISIIPGGANGGHITASGDLVLGGFISMSAGNHIGVQPQQIGEGNDKGTVITFNDSTIGFISNDFETMRLTDNNRVGIGGGVAVTNPAKTLTVKGDISASGTVFADSFQSVTGGSGIDFNDSLDLKGDITASGNISSSTTSTGSFGHITTDGRVDIGGRLFVSNDTANFSQVNVGGGFGATGVTITSAGAIQANNSINTDGTISASGKITGDDFEFNLPSVNERKFRGLTNVGVRLHDAAGGWAMSYGFQGNGEEDLGGFGAFGGGSLEYFFVGNHYQRSVMTIHSGSNNGVVIGDGIVSTVPTKALQVKGDISASGDIIIEGNISSSNTGNNYIAGNTRFSRDNNFFPTHLIHLSGSDGDGALIRVQGDPSRGGTIEYNRGTSYTWRAGVGGGSSDNSNIPSSFFGIEDASGGNEVAIAIAHTTQNVGIGTTNPTETLEIVGGGRIKVTPGSDATGSILSLAHDQDVILSTENDSATGHPQQFVLKHNLGDTELINRRGDLILSASGNIGIGTTSPSEMLHLKSTGDVVLKLEADSDNVTETDNPMLLLTQDAGGVSASISIDSSNKMVIAAGYSHADGHMIFNTRKTSERMRITGDGNVGIGTTTPTKPLTVEGDISSSGNIHIQGGDGVNGTKIFFNSPSTSDGFFNYDNSSKEMFVSADNFRVSSHITASGNISSSGTLIANAISLPNDSISGDKIEGGTIGSVTITDLTATSLNVTHFTSSFITSSTIQTEGSNIFGDTIADTHTFNGHITASGNISASGGAFLGFGTFAASTDTKTDAAIVIPEEKAIYTVDGGQYLRNLIKKSSDVIQIGQSGTALVDEIRLLPGNAGFTTFYGDTTEVARVDASGNITASGDISASGTIVANELQDTSLTSGRVVTTTTNGVLNDSSTFTFGSNLVTISSTGAGLKVDSGGATGGHITASGDLVLGGHISMSAGEHIGFQPGEIGAGNDKGTVITFNNGTIGFISNEFETMRLTSDNKVGIGGGAAVTNPAKTLTVQGSISASAGIHTPAHYFTAGTGDDYILYLSTTDSMEIKSQDINMNPGNGVGIGTGLAANNDSKLHVYGDMKVNSHITASGNISASGNIVGNQLHVTHHNMASVGDSEVYIPGIATSEGDSVSYQRQWVAPFDGSLEKIRLYAASAGGDTVCKLYVDRDFNAGESANSTSDTVSVSATTTATFTFSSGNTYSAGDLIRVSIDGTNSLGNVNLTCIWNYNTSTL